jgi:DNA helicase IV
MEDKVYEHEVVTTVRITVRSLSPYLDKVAFLEDYAELTCFSDLMDGEDYPRVVATSVIDDEVDYFNKELNDE